MAKFDFKGMAKNAKDPAIQIALMTGGVIAAQKFADFKTLFPNADPEAWYIKHEGVVKVGGVILTVAMWKGMPNWMKWILMGVAIQGGIKAVRQYTMNAETGKSFVEQIGNRTSTDAEIEAAANEILTSENVMAAAANTSVAGPGNTSKLMQAESETSVAGMGLGNAWGNNTPFANMKFAA